MFCRHQNFTMKCMQICYWERPKNTVKTVLHQPTVLSCSTGEKKETCPLSPSLWLPSKQTRLSTGDTVPSEYFGLNPKSTVSSTGWQCSCPGLSAAVQHSGCISKDKGCHAQHEPLKLCRCKICNQTTHFKKAERFTYLKNWIFFARVRPYVRGKGQVPGGSCEVLDVIFSLPFMASFVIVISS